MSERLALEPPPEPLDAVASFVSDAPPHPAATRAPRARRSGTTLRGVTELLAFPTGLVDKHRNSIIPIRFIEIADWASVRQRDERCRRVSESVRRASSPAHRRRHVAAARAQGRG